MDDSRQGPRPPLLLAGMSYRLKHVTIYWSCGHVSTHGAEGNPNYCPYCAPDSGALITQELQCSS
jgi:hypothetical protein